MAVSFNAEDLFKQIMNGTGIPQGTDADALVKQAEALFKSAQGASDTFTKGTTGATGTSSATTSKSVAEAEAALKDAEATLKELQDKQEKIEKKMDKVQERIDKLVDEIQAKIAAALENQETAIAENEEESQNVINEQVAAYVNANKNGEGMTYDELQANIQNNLPDGANIAAATAALAQASGMMGKVDGLIKNLKSLRTELAGVINQVASQKAVVEQAGKDVDAAKKAEEEKKKQQSCCDPIGFEYTDKETGEKAKFDFIVDDGNFDSTSDFLGSEKGFEEMAALDTDGDNKVSAEELKAGNVKAVKTDANGNKTVVDISETFGEDFSIDLASYQQGGTHSAVDTAADDDGDGVSNQNLVGTFNINIGEESVSAYNTLDDVDWLSSNYGVAGAEDKEEQAGNDSLVLSTWDAKIELDEQKLDQLKESAKNAAEQLGISENIFDDIYALNVEEIQNEKDEDEEVTTDGEETEAVDETKEDSETTSTEGTEENNQELTEEEQALINKYNNGEAFTEEEADALVKLLEDKKLAPAEVIAQIKADIEAQKAQAV